MSMEAFAEARKQKLSLLRKRKDDEASGRANDDDENDASLMIKRHFRNYDPLTGQMKRFGGIKDLPDTVEKDVDGLQESAIEEDKRRQMEELVSNASTLFRCLALTLTHVSTGPNQHRTQETELGLEKRPREETEQARKERQGGSAAPHT